MNHEPHERHERMLYKEECYVIQGAIFEVYREMEQIASEHKAQVFNYLKATGLKLGLVVNFGHYPKAQPSERKNNSVKPFRVFCVFRG